MNDRIRELAEKAGFSQLDIRNAFDYNEDNPYNEFAKLIVQECMNLVKDCYAEPGRCLYQSVCASTIIEEHFGIEE